ncbi:MAG TPA: aldehyde dehydrogenase [Phaeodactylibacter sp.]|nr:aldehyde dehydrogenase [Phaeodactylibacter sp.]
MQTQTQTQSISTSIAEKYRLQKAFFASGATRSLAFRRAALKSLKAAIREYEEDILDALYSDFRKPRFESYTSEVGFLYQEISHTLRELPRWMQSRRQFAPMALFFSRSAVHYEPRGLTLILGPWNYPFQLLMAPLTASVAAGNCAIVKTSSQTPATAAVTAKVIARAFAPEHVTTVSLPGREVIPQLIEPLEFNHVFFTGSVPVGRLVMEACAKHLSSVTLELGGKSPCIVDESANLDVAAKRIAWGKTFNGGQTCVAPDYLLVKENVKDELLKRIARYFREAFGESPQKSPHMAHIINRKRFDALTKLMQNGKIVYGGRSWPEELYIEPTIIEGVSLQDPIMQEEIFGPLLPVLSWKSVEELKTIISHNPYPLAFYLFAKNRKLEKALIRDISFGGGCVNNTLVHVADPNVPFGGFQTSGLGNYHGKEGFETFSHKKSILKTSFWPDLPFLFPPYAKWKEKVARMFL